MKNTITNNSNNRNYRAWFIASFVCLTVSLLFNIAALCSKTEEPHLNTVAYAASSLRKPNSQALSLAEIPAISTLRRSPADAETVTEESATDLVLEADAEEEFVQIGSSSAITETKETAAVNTVKTHESMTIYHTPTPQEEMPPLAAPEELEALTVVEVPNQNEAEPEAGSFTETETEDAEGDVDSKGADPVAEEALAADNISAPAEEGTVVAEKGNLSGEIADAELLTFEPAQTEEPVIEEAADGEFTETGDELVSELVSIVDNEPQVSEEVVATVETVQEAGTIKSGHEDDMCRWCIQKARMDAGEELLFGLEEEPTTNPITPPSFENDQYWQGSFDKKILYGLAEDGVTDLSWVGYDEAGHRYATETVHAGEVVIHEGTASYEDGFFPCVA